MWWRKGRSHGDFTREIDAHLAAETERFASEGMNPEEARAAALRSFGNVMQAKERFYESRRAMWLEDARTDLRHAFRTLARNPGFTAAAVLTSALGIGANTAMFSVVNSVLLKPLPYKDSHQLVRLVSNIPAAAPATETRTRLMGSITVAELIELRPRTKTLSHIGVYVPSIVTLTGREETARLEGWRVEPAILHMLGARPLIGRIFAADEAAPGADAVIVLSYFTWQRNFGGDPKILGQSIALDGRAYSIIGVMPRGFEFPFELANRQFWIPLVLTVAGEAVRVRVPMMARLANGIAMEAAAAEVSAILRDSGAGPQGGEYEFIRAQDELVAPVRPSLLLLTAAVGFVLLIACFNVANLLLARTAARQREIAIRVALGAGRSRVIRSLMSESILLALLGGATGALLASGGIRLLRTLAATLPRMDLGTQASFPRLDEIAMDSSALAFTIAIAVLTGVLVGLASAIRYSRPARMDMIGESTAPTVSGFNLFRRYPARGLFVVAEVAMAMVVLVCGGLLIHSFAKLATVHLGYDPSHLLTFQVALPKNRYPGTQIKTFAEDLVTRLRSVPGVSSAAYATQLPMVSLISNSAWFRRTPDLPKPAPSQGNDADARFVSRDYLNTMGTRVTAGRVFGEHDGERQPRVILINKALAGRYFPGENPLGKIAYLLHDPHFWQIVGIVEDVRQVSPGQEPEPQVFVDIQQWSGVPPGFGFLRYFAVRTSGNPASAVSHVRGVVRQLDSQATVYNVAPMAELVSNSMSRPRLNAVLVGIFGSVALALAAIGIHGLMAYSVAQRTREIGIRMALGARRTEVMGMVLRQSILLTVTGMVLGGIGAALVTRYLRGMLFGLTPLDPLTLLVVPCTFTFVAILASYAPARRATQVDPLVALRWD